MSVDRQRRFPSPTPGSYGKEFTPWVVVVSVPMDSPTLKYKKKCLGYFPDGVTKDLSVWKLSRIFEDKNSYNVKKGSTIYRLLNQYSKFSFSLFEVMFFSLTVHFVSVCYTSFSSYKHLA